MKSGLFAAVGIALALVAGCGDGEPPKGKPSATTPAKSAAASETDTVFRCFKREQLSREERRDATTWRAFSEVGDIAIVQRLGSPSEAKTAAGAVTELSAASRGRYLVTAPLGAQNRARALADCLVE